MGWASGDQSLNEPVTYTASAWGAQTRNATPASCGVAPIPDAYFSRIRLLTSTYSLDPPPPGNKKADVAQRPQALGHVGLLFNKPPSRPGLLFI